MEIAFARYQCCEKAKQNSARNNAKYSKCFQFLCNKSDRTCSFSALTFARSLWRCRKPRPSASVFNTSHGTWQMLMHEKPCLIPIIKRIYINRGTNMANLNVSQYYGSIRYGIKDIHSVSKCTFLQIIQIHCMIYVSVINLGLPNNQNTLISGKLVCSPYGH